MTKPANALLRPVFAGLLLGAVAGLSACGFRHESVLEPTIMQADAFAEQCRRNNIANEQVKAAQEDLTQARAKLEAREKEEAWYKADLALVRFQLAIAQAQKQQALAEDSVASASLQSDQKDLANYEKLLADVKTRRGIQ